MKPLKLIVLPSVSVSSGRSVIASWEGEPGGLLMRYTNTCETASNVKFAFFRDGEGGPICKDAQAGKLGALPMVSISLSPGRGP